MNYNKLESIRKVKKISQEELAKNIGLTKNGYQLAIKNDTLKVKDLISISNVLGVPSNIFFEESPSVVLQEPAAIYQVNNKGSCANCERLQKLIDSQSRHIERLENDLETTRERLRMKEAG